MNPKYSKNDQRVVKGFCVALGVVATTIASLAPPVVSRVGIGVLTYCTSRYITDDPRVKKSMKQKWYEKFGNNDASKDANVKESEKDRFDRLAREEAQRSV